MPLRSGYLEALAGISGVTGPWGRLEAGLHPWEHVAAFADAQVDRDGPSAGVGLKWTFEL